VFLDENPYKCSQCTKAFAKPVSLKIHMTSHNKQKALLSRPRKKKMEDEESWSPESEAIGREDEETASCAVSSNEEKEKEQEQDQKEVSRRTSACKYRGSSVADPNPDPSDLYVFGLLDPDPGPLVRGMDPDPDPSITKQK
jgi:hypothetical protein